MVVKALPNGEDVLAKGDRRRAILDAATVLFAERGFGAVSVQEIADAFSALERPFGMDCRYTVLRSNSYLVVRGM